MNYITQLNRFYDSLQTNSLTPNSICLYSMLLHINNKCNWKAEFTVANKSIEALTGLSRIQLDRVRNELKQKGYINYKKGAGSIAGTYSIINLYAVSDTQAVTQADTQSDTQSNTQAEHKPSRDSIIKTKTKFDDSLYKLNTNARTREEAEKLWATTYNNLVYLCNMEVPADAAFGDDDIVYEVVNIILNVLESNQGIELNEVFHSHDTIKGWVRVLDARAFGVIMQNFYELKDKRFIRKQISNPYSYVFTALQNRYGGAQP